MFFIFFFFIRIYFCVNKDMINYVLNIIINLFDLIIYFYIKIFLNLIFFYYIIFNLILI